MELAPFQLERYFARWEFQVRHLLCASDPQTLRQAELLAYADDELRAWWRDLTLGYTESLGHPRLRRAIAGLYTDVRPDEILTMTGAQEGIFLAIHALVRPGDEVVVITPAYQSLHEVARSIGARVIEVPLDPNGWSLPLESLQRLVTERTRLLVINFPHNPTGATLSRAEFDEIVALCERNGTYLLSDEVYRLLEHPGTERLPAAADAYARALSLGVASKPFGLAGLRVGWLATRDREVHARLTQVKDYTTICSSAPSEVLATIALEAREPIVARVLDIALWNLNLLDEFVARHGEWISWTRPRAGVVGAPRLRGDARPFIESLVHDEGVLLLPGTVFGLGPEYFRIGFGREDMPEALERMERHLLKCGA